ncbi:MAG: exopolysaccharide Pel transporter PelG [Eubacterium sp.]|nr:exopolysaccharide Pel transporter PelG [Eubacterium sp.]
MAGIGFELNQMYKENGLAGKIRGIGYSGVIVAGPMLLGMALIGVLSGYAGHVGMSNDDRTLFQIMVTYSMLVSLFVNGFVSLPYTRYVADQMYVGKNNRIMPALFGCISIALPVSAVVYWAFLTISGIPLAMRFVNITILSELICIFLVNGDLTAIRNFRGILFSYGAAILAAMGAILALTHFFGVSVLVFLIALAVGYGIQLTLGLLLLADFFPTGSREYYRFLPWYGRYSKLVANGVLMNAGLFFHMFIVWGSNAGTHIQGLFYMAQEYDIPALYTYMSTLVTNIFFVSSAETRFFEKYSAYYSSLNTGETYDVVRENRQEMLLVMWRDILHCAVIQLLFTILMQSVGLPVTRTLQPGFTSQMKNYFIILCVGYGTYATGNLLMMYSMYFTDYDGVLFDSLIFAITTTMTTLITVFLGQSANYGIGFVIGSFCYLITSYIRLRIYTKNLEYEVLALKPFYTAPRQKKVRKKAKKKEQGTEDRA